MTISCMIDLPNELLVQILAELELLDLIHCSLVRVNYLLLLNS